jgi:putative ABC transport system permease protein
VLGATAGSIMIRMSGQFASLARSWLNNFAYRINIGWWSFALAGLVVVALPGLVSSYHAFRAANLNPAQVLKHAE